MMPSSSASARRQDPRRRTADTTGASPWSNARIKCAGNLHQRRLHTDQALIHSAGLATTEPSAHLRTAPGLLQGRPSPPDRARRPAPRQKLPQTGRRSPYRRLRAKGSLAGNRGSENAGRRADRRRKRIVIINTGAETVLPPIAGIAGSKRVHTSTSILELDELPHQLVIVRRRVYRAGNSRRCTPPSARVTVSKGSRADSARGSQHRL